LKDSLFIIAEAGVNHDGSLKKAMQLIDAAVQANADAVKFQSFSAKRLVRRGTELVPYQIGSAENHYDLLKQLELDEPQQTELAEYAKSQGIEFLSTPYSEEDANFLMNLGVKAIKVASADIVDIGLHTLLCQRKVKVFASTGMSTMDEVSRLAQLYKSFGNLDNLWLLQCVSNYPSSLKTQNLRVLDSYKYLVGNRLGFSDHTEGTISALVAMGAGARVFEKHLTLDRTQKGPDHQASLEPTEFLEYADTLRKGFEALGMEAKQPQPEELEMRRISRKGAYVNRHISPGETIGISDVDLIRPAQGTDAWATITKLPLVSKTSYMAGDLLSLEKND
jgi:N,N'-diacetyllegionaminate synthase